MRIAMFNAYQADRPYQQSLPSLGLGYLIAYLKRHCPSVEAVFCLTEKDLLESGADVVAISSTSENYDDACRTAQRVREADGALVVLGGVHVTALPHRLPEVFDIGVLGEGEETLRELVRLLESAPRPDPADLQSIAGVCYRDNGGNVFRTAARKQIRDLDSLPFPDRDALGSKWKTPYSQAVHLIASRGCPYKCSFCASGRLWKNYRVFSAEYVVAEIEHVIEKYDPREIHFFDDLFIAHKGRFRKFSELIETRGLHRDRVFRTWARADMIDEEMADRLARLNFRSVDFGVESGCQKVLEYLGKSEVTPEINERAINLLADRGISVGVSMIIGAPNETRDQLEMTYQFLESIRSKVDRLGVGLLMPLPGTPVWDEALERGIVSEDMEWDRLGIDFEKGDIRRCPIVSRELDGAELSQVFRRFNQLQHIVNARGEVRRLTEENWRLGQELEALQAELESLKGSRAVKAALKVRELTRRLRDIGPNPSGRHVEPQI
jgi:anaerobic magnesium-protoporphyrin IX monomethyl ester cyclase